MNILTFQYSQYAHTRSMNSQRRHKIAFLSERPSQPNDEY